MALAAGVDQAADPDAITNLETADLRADVRDRADDLVTWNHRIKSHAPVVMDKMQIGMTDTAIVDVNDNIVGARIAPINGERSETGFRRLSSVGTSHDSFRSAAACVACHTMACH